MIVNDQIEVSILGGPNVPLEPAGVADAGIIFFALRAYKAASEMLPLPGAGHFRIELDGRAVV